MSLSACLRSVSSFISCLVTSRSPSPASRWRCSCRCWGQSGSSVLLIDLKDANFQIPIHPDLDSQYQQIGLNVKVYQFKAHCFSLSTTPQVFPKVFSLVLEWAHRRRTQLLWYPDNWLIIVESAPHLLEHQELFLPCKYLGTVVIWKKSDVKPTS